VKLSSQSNIVLHMKDKEEIKKRLSIELSETKHHEIKLAALHLGMTMKDFVDEAVLEKLVREKLVVLKK